MEYNLKDKIQITKEFLNDLELKSWQEVEHLQNQIANIEETEENLNLVQLFKNLLTSYYVFIGGLENLSSTGIRKAPVKIQDAEPVELEIPEEDLITEPVEDVDFFAASSVDANNTEPFEYFVDFDDPIGEPISDEDLYGN